MAENDVLRMRATLVPDDVVAAARLMAVELQRIGRGVDVRPHIAQFNQMNVSVRTVASTIRGSLVPALSAMGFAVGSFGVTALGFTRAMTETSNKIIELRNNARTLNLSTRDLKGFTEAAERAGLSPQQMASGLQAFIRNTEDFAVRMGSVREELNQLGAGHVVARINAGKDNIDKVRIAFEHMQKLWQDDPSGFKARRFAEIIGLGPEAALLSWQQIMRAIEGTKDLTAEQIKAAEDYKNAVIDIDEAWEKVKRTMVPMAATWAKLLTDPKSALDQIKKEIAEGAPKPLLAEDPMTADQSRFRFPRAEDPMNADRQARKHYFFDQGSGRSFYRPMSFGGALDRGNPEDVMKDAVRAGVVEGLTEYAGGGTRAGIMNAALTTGGGAGGGNVFGSREYPNLGSAPNGAVVDGGGMTRGDRNNNPGNLKMGSLAQAFGATQADNRGFAIFPNRLSGEAAHEALIKSDRYKGLTLQQFARKYAEGSPDWQNTVGKALGIGPGDVVDNNDPRLAGAIRRAEGTGGGGSSMSASGGVPSDVMSRARGLIARGGSTGELQRFMAEQGYPKSGAWCGQFAAAVVKSAGGTPPKGAAVASNWRNWGEAVDPNDVREGDVAVRKGVPTGSTGSHVGFVGKNLGDGRFRMEGGNQGGPYTDSLGRYDFRRGPRAMDEALGIGGVTAKGSVSVNVNAPKGWTTDAKSEGMFQETKINRQQQMQPTEMGY